VRSVLLQWAGLKGLNTISVTILTLQATADASDSAFNVDVRDANACIIIFIIINMRVHWPAEY